MKYIQVLFLVPMMFNYINGSFFTYNSVVYNSVRARNNILRKFIMEDTNRAKLFIQKTKFLYNRILSKYYEINEKYYSLSETERTTIETIISISY